MDAARCFFRLPDSAKFAVRNRPEVQYQVRNPRDSQVYAVPGSGNGYRGTGEDVYFAKDQRESINFGREPLEAGEDPPYRNLWPAEQLAGHTVSGDADLLPAGWRNTVLAHQHQMLQLSVRLRQLLALALGARADAFDEFFERPTFQTGMVFYHAVVSDPVWKTPSVFRNSSSNGEACVAPTKLIAHASAASVLGRARRCSAYDHMLMAGYLPSLQTMASRGCTFAPQRK